MRIVRIQIACFAIALCAAASDASRMDWIRQLASEHYKERVKATEALWAEGAAAKDDLITAVKSKDPEVAMRARDLLRKIDLGIQPDTDPRIIQLTNAYQKADQKQKVAIIQELRRQRGWRQMLKLYAAESDDTTRATLARLMDTVALYAARERIALGDDEGALEFLEMVRTTEAGLISLAAHHRAKGTLNHELQAALRSSNPKDLPWRCALQRVSGDAGNAAKSAIESNNSQLAAALSIFCGDPLPWLASAATEADANHEPAIAQYARAAMARWQGKSWKAERENIRRQMRSPDDATRLTAMSQLFLLGDVIPTWQVFATHYPDEAFAAFDSLESLDQAIDVLNLDQENPDFAKALHPLLKKICVAPGRLVDDEDLRETAVARFIAICGFLERRGLSDVLDDVVMARVIEFSKIHQPRFMDLVGELFGVPGTRTVAPEFAFRIAQEWAGANDERWKEMMITAFGDEAPYHQCWEFLGRIHPDAAAGEKMESMLAIFNYIRDPDGLYFTWIDHIFNATNDPETKEIAIEILEFLVATQMNVDVAEKLKKLRMPAGADQADARPAEVNLLIDAAMGGWDSIAEMFLAQLAMLAERGDHRPEMHAYASCALRNAGRIRDADAHEAWVESLALGDARSNLAIAQAFSFGRDYDRAMRWYHRAVMECQPTDGRFQIALQGYLGELLERKEFALIASCSEVLAQIESRDANFGFAPALSVRLRQQSDFSRALAMPVDRAETAGDLLRSAHAMAPTDGALADHFFPSLLESPYQDLHNELFELSWNIISSNLDRYPNADNAMNTAVWLASRAARRLEEAEQIQNKALKLFPRSAAYLDTMAEVRFAQGNRNDAIRFGELALRNIPSDPMIIRQVERFRHGKFPKQ